jgi:uncharacterized membrane protein YphA (DoxX/SURF4 family)
MMAKATMTQANFTVHSKGQSQGMALPDWRQAATIVGGIVFVVVVVGQGD